MIEQLEAFPLVKIGLDQHASSNRQKRLKTGESSLLKLSTLTSRVVSVWTHSPKTRKFQLRIKPKKHSRALLDIHERVLFRTIDRNRGLGIQTTESRESQLSSALARTLLEGALSSWKSRDG